jgi:hypothetical protein
MHMSLVELFKVICPACGQQVEAVARDGRVKGYCAIAKQYVDSPIEKQCITETKAEMSVGLAPIREGRDSKGHFVKGNVPLTKRNYRINGNDSPSPSGIFSEGLSCPLEGFVMKHIPHRG